MGPLDSTIVSVTLPTISHELGMDYTVSVWVPTAYLVVTAALLLTMGRLSDMRGRRSIYMAGFGVFALGSLLCSLALDGPQLILFRGLQGVGAAALMATAPALITDAFPPQERGKALGINAMSVYIGLSLGPPLGAFLTGELGWRSIFWVNIPIAAAVIALAYWKIARPSRVEDEGRFDLAGASSFAIALTAFLLALTFGESRGWLSAFTLGLFLLSAALFVVFIVTGHHLGRCAMFQLDLVTRNRLFAASNLSALLNYTSYFGTSFILSFYLQRVLEMSLYATGLVLLSMPVVMSVLSPISGWISDKVGSRVLASTGMFLMAAGLLLMSTLSVSSSAAEVVAWFVLMGVGMGLFASPNTSAIMGCVERDRLGVASGTLSTMRTVGQSMSLAIMGALIATATSTELVSALFMGAPLPPGTANADFVNGMALAFRASALIAVAGGVISLARGRAGRPDRC
jgi:EmrB/QacA subfamily drug resistance transporter